MSIGKLPWRVGMRVGRTIYDADDNLIGMLDTAELAERAVEAVNRSFVSGSARRGEWSAEDLSKEIA